MYLMSAYLAPAYSTKVLGIAVHVHGMICTCKVCMSDILLFLSNLCTHSVLGLI